jgi:hypothetical protein
MSTIREGLHLIVQASSVIFLGLALTGCFTNRLLQPGQVPEYEGRDIVANLKNGRTLGFERSDYRVAVVDSVTALQGNGVEYLSASKREHVDFAGTIALSDIETIQIHEKTVAYYLTGALGVIAFSAVIALIVSGQHGSFKQ